MPQTLREDLTVLVVPDPKVVRRLLTRYASLQIALAEGEGGKVRVSLRT